MGSNPHANGGKLSIPLNLPSYSDYEVEVKAPATKRLESTRELGWCIPASLLRSKGALHSFSEEMFIAHR
jgi:phosphoketolase